MRCFYHIFDVFIIDVLIGHVFGTCDYTHFVGSLQICLHTLIEHNAFITCFYLSYGHVSIPIV